MCGCGFFCCVGGGVRLCVGGGLSGGICGALGVGGCFAGGCGVVFRCGCLLCSGVCGALGCGRLLFKAVHLCFYRLLGGVGFRYLQRDLVGRLGDQAFGFLGGAVFYQLSVGIAVCGGLRGGGFLGSVGGCLGGVFLPLGNRHVGFGNFQRDLSLQRADRRFCLLRCVIAVLQGFLYPVRGNLYRVLGCHLGFFFLELRERLANVR